MYQTSMRDMRPGPSFLVFPIAARSSVPLGVALDTGRFDRGVEIRFQLVVARHFVELAVFLAQAEPPALFLRKVIHEVDRNGRTDARRV
jgi:hypothetical protein